MRIILPFTTQLSLTITCEALWPLITEMIPVVLPKVSVHALFLVCYMSIVQ